MAADIDQCLSGNRQLFNSAPSVLIPWRYCWVQQSQRLRFAEWLALLAWLLSNAKKKTMLESQFNMENPDLSNMKKANWTTWMQ